MTSDTVAGDSPRWVASSRKLTGWPLSGFFFEAAFLSFGGRSTHGSLAQTGRLGKKIHPAPLTWK